VVQDGKKVTFRGEAMSPSKAALVAVHEMGFAWPSLNGFEYWTLNGKKLSELPISGDNTALDDDA
jgi:hypothetical protein